MAQETSNIPIMTQSQTPENIDGHKKGSRCSESIDSPSSPRVSDPVQVGPKPQQFEKEQSSFAKSDKSSHQKISENKKETETLSCVDVSSPTEIKKTPEKVVTVPEKVMTVPEKVVTVPEKVMTVPDKTITNLEKITTKHEQQLEQIQESINKLQTSVSNMRTDIEKLRVQVADKIPKAVLSEIEGKVNHHSKGLDAVSKKLFELQNNLTTFIQQPISHSLIDTLRTQLMQEISESIKKSLSDDISMVKSSFDDKIDETRKMINNAKRVMFSR